MQIELLPPVRIDSFKHACFTDDISVLNTFDKRIEHRKYKSKYNTQ